jgi:hypothetical protein
MQSSFIIYVVAFKWLIILSAVIKYRSSCGMCKAGHLALCTANPVTGEKFALAEHGPRVQRERFAPDFGNTQGMQSNFIIYVGAFKVLILLFALSKEMVAADIAQVGESA